MSGSIFGDEAQVCRVCGCDAVTVCLNEDGEPCSWVEDELCSACADGSEVLQVQICSDAEVGMTESPIRFFELADRAWLTVSMPAWPHTGAWAARWSWEADILLDDDGQSSGYPDAAQAICAAARGLLQSLDEADPLRRNPAVNGVARRRMERIREWAADLANRHRPMAQAVSLFGEGAR